MSDLRVLKKKNLALEVSVAASTGDESTSLIEDQDSECTPRHLQPETRKLQVLEILREVLDGTPTLQMDLDPGHLLPLLHVGTLRFYTLCNACTIIYDPPSNIQIKDKHDLICGEVSTAHGPPVTIPQYLLGKEHFIFLSMNIGVAARFSKNYEGKLKDKSLRYGGADEKEEDFNVMLVDWHDVYATWKGIGRIKQVALWHALEKAVWKQVVLR